MFQPSSKFQLLLQIVDDALVGAPEAPLPSDERHPHRVPLRWEPTRRSGSVPARPAHCLSPVRQERVARAERVAR
jgi:hypothetical protein